jgi:acyl carrier protein
MTRAETVAAFLSTRFRSALRGATPGADQPLISSGVIDSFGLMELIAFLEDTFHVVIEPAHHDPTDFETVNTILKTVAAAPFQNG